MSNSFIWLIDRTLSGATILGQSRPGSNGNQEVLCILQSSSIPGASSSDCLMSYPGHLLWRCSLSLCRDAAGVFYSLSWLGPQGVHWGSLTPLHRGSWCILQPQHFWVFWFIGRRKIRCWIFLFYNCYYPHKLFLQKSPQISWTLLSILVDFNCALVWMISAFSLIFSFLNLFLRSWQPCPRALTITDITVTFMFHSFFSSLWGH